MTAHRHATSMRQYYLDAMKTETPWDRWEMSYDAVYWMPCDDHPAWKTFMLYRHRPRTININGFEVPEPLRELPDSGNVFLTQIAAMKPVTIQLQKFNRRITEKWLELGLLHETREAAYVHMKALRSFTQNEKRKE
mgnify:CR=1 FL=1